MDRFSISLDGYHELTQTQPELPRTHIIESCAKTLDSKWKVTRTPGVAQGAELPLKLLLEEEIRKHVSITKYSLFQSNDCQIKFDNHCLKWVKPNFGFSMDVYTGH